MPGPIEEDEESRLRREAAEEEERWHYEAEELARLEAEAKEKELADEKESAIETMVEWFGENFEDPANETPWDNEDKAYVYIWGGPFDAQDMIGDRFYHEFPDTWIEEAVEIVQRDGIFDWAPKPHGEFFEHPDQEEETLARISEIGQNVRESILSGLNDLESVLARLPIMPEKIGHNRPPEEIGLPPYDDGVKGEIEKHIIVIRHQIELDMPNREILKDSESAFRRVGEAIIRWLGRKADVAIDETIKTSIRVGLWASAAATLFGLADDLSKLVNLFL